VVARGLKVLRVARRVAIVLVVGVGLLAIGGLVLQAVFEREAAKFPPPGNLVTVDGKRRLHVVCEGTGSPTVILEAGGTHFSTEYASVLHGLGAKTRVCAYDRAGMGWSDPSSKPLSARALVDDLSALLAGSKIDPPYVIVAGSAGGMVAELYTREHPDVVAGLVLLDAVTGRMIDDMPVAGDHMARRACLARTLNRFGLLRLLDPLDRRRLAHGRDLALSLTYRRSTWASVCSLLEARNASADQIRAAPPLRDDLRLVIVRHDSDGPEARHASPDEAIPEWQWDLEQAHNAALSHRGELLVATGSGHHIAEDRPDFVIATVGNLIDAIRRE
jgi:pimeloyl-ACP methyl ester carboxylesterase